MCRCYIMIAFKNKLSIRLFAPLIIIFLLTFAVLSFYVPNITQGNAISLAVESAESTVQQYKTIRGYYTEKVIKKIIPIADISLDFKNKNKKIRSLYLQLLFIT